MEDEIVPPTPAIEVEDSSVISPDSDNPGVADVNDVCPCSKPSLPVDCTGRPLRDCNGTETSTASTCSAS